MPIATQLKTQIEAVQARIVSLAPTATAEDVVMLAKAVEAVAGQATLLDLKIYAEELAATLNEMIVAADHGVESAVAQNLLTIETAKQHALNEINTSPLTLASLHSYNLAI